MKGVTYKDAGVDVDKAEGFVEALRGLVAKTHRPWVLKGVGGFGALIRPPEGYRRPLLVAACDGVGTKVLVASAAGRFDTVGVDLVAMCVNDLLTLGARPLFFLDYFATGRLEPERDVELMKGIVRGCEEADCPLVGGETAEMPGLYPEGTFDLAGFAVGVVEEGEVVDGSSVSAGDLIVGLASSGLHSNGFSLVRKVLLEGMALDTWVEELGTTLEEELLRPTRIYVKPVLKLMEEFSIKAMAHITGGGIPGNLPRVLPEGLGATIRPHWPVPPIFSIVQKAGVHEGEMWRTFNMGVGFVLVCPREEAEGIMRRAVEIGERAFVVGEVREGEGVFFEG